MKGRPRKSDPEFGPVCSCGAPKAKQSWTCQPCHSRLRGYGAVSLSEQNRRWRQKYLGIVGAVGEEDPARLRVELDSVRRSLEGELAALIAEQEKDERSGHKSRDRWMVSLDSVDQYGRPLYEVLSL